MSKDYTKPQDDYTKPLTDYSKHRSSLHVKGDRNDALARLTSIIIALCFLIILGWAAFSNEAKADVVISQESVDYCEYKAEMTRDIKKLKDNNENPQQSYDLMMERNNKSHITVKQKTIVLAVNYVYHPDNNLSGEEIYEQIRQLCIRKTGWKKLEYMKNH